MAASSVQFERYSAAHRAGCLAVFDSNREPFFAVSERAEFETFLDQHTAESYYAVVLEDGAVVACGGFGEFDGRLALTWGMVQRAAHRNRYGTLLLAHRLEALRRVHGSEPVYINTSQHTEGFFAKHGFRTLAVKADGFAPGLHKVSMVRDGD